MLVFEFTRSPLSLPAQIPFCCLISKQELLLLVLKSESSVMGLSDMADTLVLKPENYRLSKKEV